MHQPDTLELSTPDRLVLDRYRLVRRLGEGGFGTVWLARDERLDRPVAVKRIPLERDRDQRAEREAHAAARLAHPGIVALYEAGRDDDAWYLVSELVEGRTLGELEREGALSDRDVAGIGAALCDALEHAHGRGVIHRDVKPGNVMVADRPDHGGGIAKLTDFGIARLVDATVMTRTGDLLGTLAYMAPEQAEGRAVSPATDLYALALVLYEALAGVNPVRGENAAATARRVGMPIPPLRRARRDLPPALCAAIDRALDPLPEHRGGVADLRAALAAAERVLDDEPGLVEPGPLEAAAERTRTWRARPAERPAPEPASAAELALAQVADRPRPRVTLPGRAFAGVAAGALAAWAVDRLALDASLGGALADVEPLAAAGAVGVAVALLPRLAWLVAVAVVLAGLGAERSAVAVAAAAVPVVLLVPRAGTLWSLPAAAPALGVAGLAGAYPVLAGLASGLVPRAALGALGLWWLAIADVVADRRPDLDALVEPGVLALAGVWAAAAAVLPLLVRGRRAAVDVVAATVWAAALASSTGAVAEALAVDEPSGAVAGAVIGAVVAVGLRAVRPPTVP